jgi:hypothetical protein
VREVRHVRRDVGLQLGAIARHTNTRRPGRFATPRSPLVFAGEESCGRPAQML